MCTEIGYNAQQHAVHLSAIASRAWPEMHSSNKIVGKQKSHLLTLLLGPVPMDGCGSIAIAAQEVLQSISSTLGLHKDKGQTLCECNMSFLYIHGQSIVVEYTLRSVQPTSCASAECEVNSDCLC